MNLNREINKNITWTLGILVVIYLTIGVVFYINDYKTRRMAMICPEFEQMLEEQSKLLDAGVVEPPLIAEPDFSKCYDRPVDVGREIATAATLIPFWLPLIIAHSYLG